jgi:hypothetical protein
MSNFYARLRQKRGDDDELAACIERVINRLETASTTGDRPGMLLGKIQSGKTRAFVGVIARAFDRGFDIALVLTKGTKTLSAQTVARLTEDLEEFIEDDELLVFDIMKLGGTLRRSELRRKLVIVAKKRAQRQLHHALATPPKLTSDGIEPTMCQPIHNEIASFIWADNVLRHSVQKAGLL